MNKNKKFMFHPLLAKLRKAEARSLKKYRTAFAKYLRTGDPTEIRALTAREKKKYGMSPKEFVRALLRKVDEDIAAQKRAGKRTA